MKARIPRRVPIIERLRSEAYATQGIVAALGVDDTDAQAGAILQGLRYAERLGRREERRVLHASYLKTVIGYEDRLREYFDKEIAHTPGHHKLLAVAWAAMDSMKGAERTPEQQALWEILGALDPNGEYRK